MRTVFLTILSILIVTLAPQQGRADDSQKQAQQPPLSAYQQKIHQNDRLVGLCRRTGVAYIPGKDVEYRPGVDVKGKPVVPADLSGSPQINVLSYPIPIPIELDILERFNLDVPIGIIAKPEIAGIFLHEDGSVTYNGTQITDKIEEFCIDNFIIEGPKATGKPVDIIRHNQTEPKPPPQKPSGEALDGEYH